MAIHITDRNNIKINIKTTMKVYSKAPFKNPYHAEASQLTLSKCQMTGLYITQDFFERNRCTDLKIFRNAKNC